MTESGSSASTSSDGSRAPAADRRARVLASIALVLAHGGAAYLVHVLLLPRGPGQGDVAGGLHELGRLVAFAEVTLASGLALALAFAARRASPGSGLALLALRISGAALAGALACLVWFFFG